FAVEPSRWIYGLPGVWLAQTFSFTPVAFLVLIGVVEGVSPSLEEASQTLRADRWQTFRRVSLPLMRPGLANAFLVGFIESIADFGNPIVLGGNFGVLSTEVFFSIVGAQLDQGRAAALGVLLLALALGAFFGQRRVVGRGVYTSISGKGDAGRSAPLPPPVQRLAFGVALPWAMLTLLIFAIPGTVIGVSYILAFNVPPIELTGTGLILIVCFVFRNMPVGVRAGVAAMSQIDGSLDEASRTLGGRSFVTLRRVILPLLRPAVVAALVYSFVRAMTTVSAVIFLVSADYDMATTYIIHRVLNGDYGVAIAYSSVL